MPPHLSIMVGDHFPIMSINLSIVVIYYLLVGTIDFINLALYLLFRFTLGFSHLALQFIGVELCHIATSPSKLFRFWLTGIRQRARLLT
ncbi:hypothetical protein Q671_10315 [Halomonas sp. PBN3]|nr:hypothetical protein Q671_10315 [Halomonas sp. PBN3]